ncbi:MULTISPECIES: cytochrome c biogenesis protein ResB [Actinomyces]|uniref:Cytochrome c biogenesis protein ResB n=1 Tax=Actinomyces marmotae TaxID=2737173 RepID=A0A6M8B5R1_9ACTO|nr:MULTISPECIES: cytochrome c biogenesis protein ResB [Actinomyces]QKD79920.1 cytochrome c biogenesis protein ResB [Actinomyces marmotae]
MTDKAPKAASGAEGPDSAAEVTAPDISGGERDVPVVELFLWLYRLFYSKTLGLTVILLFALYAFIGSLLPQATKEVLADPRAKEAFLKARRPALGRMTTALDALGLFHVFTSIGFYVVVSLLALSIIACTVHRVPELVKREREPRVHVAPRFFDKARYRARVPSPDGVSASLEATREALRKARWRVIPDDRDPEHCLYADRNARSGIGTVLAHAAFVLILGAFVVSSTWGVEEDLTVPVGSSVEIGHGTGLSVRANSFTDSYTDTGQPMDYVSDLSILSGETEVARQEVRVNSPLSIGGYRLHQASYGTSADVTIADADGNVLAKRSVPLRWQTPKKTEVYGRADLPDGRVIYVFLPASGQAVSKIAPGTAVFGLAPDGYTDPQSQQRAEAGATAQLEDLSVTFERERQYTGLTLRRDPGTPIMWAASALLMIGMSITFLMPYRRLWARVEPDEKGTGSVIRLGSVSRLDITFERMFAALVGRIESAVGSQDDPEDPDPATTAKESKEKEPSDHG